MPRWLRPSHTSKWATLFCNNNIESKTGNSYNNFYGSAWDDKYGPTSATTQEIASQVRNGTGGRPSSFDLYSL